MGIKAQVAGLAVLGVALNVTIWGCIICGVWWAYNHVLAPSFGWPRLGVH